MPCQLSIMALAIFRVLSFAGNIHNKEVYRALQFSYTEIHTIDNAFATVPNQVPSIHLYYVKSSIKLYSNIIHIKSNVIYTKNMNDTKKHNI